MEHKLVTCRRCGWVHFELTREEAEQNVESFNEYYYGLPEHQRLESYGGRPSSIKKYEQCMSCGGPYTDFVTSSKDDCPNGCTINPIIRKED